MKITHLKNKKINMVDVSTKKSIKELLKQNQ